MKTVLALLLCFILTQTFSQKPKVIVCEKCYATSEGVYASDTARFLFGNIDFMFSESCSWLCNPYIHTPNKILSSPDMSDSLTNYSVSSYCLINNPMETTILYEAYITKDPGYLLLDEDEKAPTLSPEEESQIYVCGFLISNGNRNSKKEYFEYGRLKKISILIDGKNIGTITLKDTPKAQFVHFGKCFKLEYDPKVEITLKIEEIYPGSKYEQLAISELQLDGSGGHSLTDKFCKKNN